MQSRPAQREAGQTPAKGNPMYRVVLLLLLAASMLALAASIVVQSLALACIGALTLTVATLAAALWERGA